MQKNNENLVSVIYHDILGKVGNILNISDLLTMNGVELKSEQKEMLEMVKGSAVTLYELIELLRIYESNNFEISKEENIINPFEEFSYLTNKFQRLSQLLGVGLEFSAERENYIPEQKCKDLRKINLILVYLLITKVDDAAILNISQKSELNRMSFKFDIYYRGITKKVENKANDFSKYLNLEKSKVHELIYHSFLKMCQNCSVDVNSFSHEKLLSSVELVFDVKKL